MVRLIEWEKYITLMGIDIQETSKTTKNMGREKWNSWMGIGMLEALTRGKSAGMVSTTRGTKSEQKGYGKMES